MTSRHLIVLYMDQTTRQATKIIKEKVGRGSKSNKKKIRCKRHRKRRKRKEQFGPVTRTITQLAITVTLEAVGHITKDMEASKEDDTVNTI